MGFTMASCSAYITMKGVMIPGVSAGSNHVGANEMCTPQVSCPSGLAAQAESGAPTIRARTARARACRRVVPVQLASYLEFPQQKIDDDAGTDPTCMVAMAFPLRSRTENAGNVSGPLPDRHGVVLHAQRTTFFFCLRPSDRKMKPRLQIFQTTALGSWCPAVKSDLALPSWPMFSGNMQ